MAWHERERDGDAAEAARVKFERARDQAARDVEIAGLMLVVRRAKLFKAAAKLGFVLAPNFDQPAPIADLTSLAEKARALIVQNDPDAVRQGLGEIAEALEGIAQDWDPLGPLRKLQQPQVILPRRHHEVGHAAAAVGAALLEPHERHIAPASIDKAL